MQDPAAVVAAVTQELLATGQQLPAAVMGYSEKPHGFQCGSCRHARRGPVDGRGTCAVTAGPIDLNEGCCLAWAADLAAWARVEGPR
jgi:hypothetical protein